MSSKTAVVEVSDADKDGGPERPPALALAAPQVDCAIALVLSVSIPTIDAIPTETGCLAIANIAAASSKI
jgi:hypothetical protein